MASRRFRSLQILSLPTVMLLGLVNTGCPGSVSSSNNSGGGGSGGTSNGGGGAGGNGGSGGATCQPETEICDMKDNDCDGVVDNVPGIDSCACNDGAEQPCYTGPEGTIGVGTCLEGKQICAGGMWGECTGQVVPTDEACNLLDDDCNGAADDMGEVSCGVGACMATVTKCIDGVEQSCIPGQPTLEVCDGVDNNCNQLVDESDPQVGMACMTGQPGVCSGGVMSCTDGVLACAANVMPTPEVCDGIDSDCDGIVDNNIPGTGGDCSTGQLGECSAGTISCQAQGGSYIVDCYPNSPAMPEVCDGLDNNCDGVVDDNNPEGGDSCDTGQLGICQAGTLNCLNGQVQCTPNAQAAAEVCDGIDNNCDGQADEGNPGGGVACGCAGAGTTACQNGAIVCNGGPITYFSEDFSDNSAGWTLGPEWAIGPAAASTTCVSCPGQDPATDHTPTADNGVAGMVIGGCTSTAIHPYACLESPTIDLSTAQGNVYMSFWRHLHSDYPSFVHNKVEAYNGSAWVSLWSQPSGPCINDTAWTNTAALTQYDVTAHKNANFKVRFCFAVQSSGAYSGGGWNIDDVFIGSAICP
ncbi:MAG: MopE-related protein [Polyangiaceae bacterium]